MKQTFKIHPTGHSMHIPKELVEAGFVNEVQGFTNACTLIIIRPGASFNEVKRGLYLALKELQLFNDVATPTGS